jgi:tetratricopeptide (TPR) repeat protein
MAREEEAQQQIDGALAMARATGSVNAEVNALTTLALLHCHAGRPDRAATPVDRALKLADGTGERYDLASARNASGMRFRLLGDLAQAAYHHTQALEWARSTGIQETEANALIGLAEVALADDRRHDAFEAARLAVEVATSAGLRLIEADAHHALARIHDARGDADAAGRETAVALRLCEITGYRLREAAIRADEMVSNS